MGNYAKYWYKQNINPELIKEGKCIILTDKIKKDLKDFGFIEWYNFPRSLPLPKKEYELIFDMFEVDGVEYINMIYGEHEQISWKYEFEDMCKQNNIPIQKWMEG